MYLCVGLSGVHRHNAFVHVSCDLLGGVDHVVNMANVKGAIEFQVMVVNFEQPFRLVLLLHLRVTGDKDAGRDYQVRSTELLLVTTARSIIRQTRRSVFVVFKTSRGSQGVVKRAYCPAQPPCQG
jgi:hypothetical protein